MKNLISLILAFNSYVCVSQNIVYHGHESIPFNSDVWRVEYHGSGDSLVGVIYPKEGKYFKMNFIPVRDRIDAEKVQAHLLPAFNQFREEHGLSLAIENKTLSEKASEWVKLIPNIMTAEHSKLDQHPLINQGYHISEGICTIPYTQLTLVPDSMDINKVIADCIYDTFSICPVHARHLVYDCDNYEIGFGLDYRQTEIVVVIQYGYKKRG